MPEPIQDPELRAFAAALQDRYDDLAPLGGGGMSELLVGRERKLDRRVVIKRAARRLDGDGARERFTREIALLATLQHPNIVPLLSADTLDGVPYFVMPLVRGESLAQRLTRGPLSVRESVAILEDVAQALESAHAIGVIHRDIKPANILLTGSAAVVADFGIAKAVSRTVGAPIPMRTPTDLTLEGFSLGTPRYMSPEQFAADASADHRVDLYALGVVAYEMLAGAPPFTGATPSALARAHLAESPAPLRTRRGDLPPALEALVMRCLAKDPSQRPASATELLRALRSPALLERAPESGPRARTGGGATRRTGQFAAAFAGAGRELRQAWRSLARTPTLLAACLACLAVGIGSVASVFSVVSAVLLDPAPFDGADRLISVFRTVQSRAGDLPHSAPNALDLAEDPTIEGFSAFASASLLVEVGDRVAPVSTIRVTGPLFGTLRMRALHGRLITPDDDTESAPRVVVLGHDYWREQFGGNPGVIGTPLRIDGVAHDIIGILPPRFRIPNAGATYEANLWIPIRFTARDREARTSNYLRAFARLAPGRSAEAAGESLTQRFATVIERFPELKGTGVAVRPMIVDASVTLRTPVLLLFAATLAVLAIAGINVSSLLLARGIRRQPALAVRTALGATRWEVMRPVLAEGAVIALGGWVLGLGLALLAVRSIVLLGADRLPQLLDARVDPRTMAFALLAAIVATLAGTLAPAMRASRAVPADALRGGRAAAARHQHRTLATLVVVEGALAVALLIPAGLVLKSFLGLMAVDPGFEPSGLLSMQVRVSPSDYPEGVAADRFLAPALAAVRAVPGVRDAGAISQLPYHEWGWNAYVRYEGRPELPLAERPVVETRSITPSFFAVTGQRLLAGRLLDDRDLVTGDGPKRVVVNAALVKRDFDGGDPLGRLLYVGDEGHEIVGVVSDIRNFGPVTAPRPEAYWTYAQRNPSAAGFFFLIRTVADDPLAVAGDVERALRQVNARVAIARVRPMREVIDSSIGWSRFLLALFGTLAVVALLLAVAGLFGILSYAVEQQRPELGLRAALGAAPGRLARDVMQRGGLMLGLALLLGLGCAWTVTRLMTSILYGVEPLDPGVWGGATAAMLLAGLAAAALPAWRAGRTEPMVAMRLE